MSYILRKWNFVAPSFKNFLYFRIAKEIKKVSYTFPHKEAKSYKLKYFPVIITMYYFSFYNLFFFCTQPIYFFHLLRNFCNVHDHIVAFFLFLP